MPLNKENQFTYTLMHTYLQKCTCLEHRLIKSEKTASSWQRKEAEGIPQKQLPTLTTPITWRYWRIHPTRPETLLHSLERAAAGIDLHINAHKTENMRYNQTGDISTLDGTSLKLVDKFTYLGSTVSSTEKYIDRRLRKAWTAIDRLSIIWK